MLDQPQWSILVSSLDAGVGLENCDIPFTASVQYFSPEALHCTGYIRSAGKICLSTETAGFVVSTLSTQLVGRRFRPDEVPAENLPSL